MSKFYFLAIKVIFINSLVLTVFTGPAISNFSYKNYSSKFLPEY